MQILTVGNSGGLFCETFPSRTCTCADGQSDILAVSQVYECSSILRRPMSGSSDFLFSWHGMKITQICFVFLQHCRNKFSYKISWHPISSSEVKICISIVAKILSDVARVRSSDTLVRVMRFYSSRSAWLNICGQCFLRIAQVRRLVQIFPCVRGNQAMQVRRIYCMPFRHELRDHTFAEHGPVFIGTATLHEGLSAAVNDHNHRAC